MTGMVVAHNWLLTSNSIEGLFVQSIEGLFWGFIFMSISIVF